LATRAFIRVRDAETLRKVAAKVARHAKIGFGLDALGNGHEAKRVGEAAQFGDDRLLAGGGGDLVDKDTIDFDVVGLNGHQHVQAGHADAEIVERDAHTDAAEQFDGPQQIFGRSHRVSLRYLEAQIAGAEAGVAENVPDALDRRRRAFIASIVDVAEQAGGSRGLEARELGDGVAQQRQIHRPQIARPGCHIEQLADRGCAFGQPCQRFETVNAQRRGADDRLICEICGREHGRQTRIALPGDDLIHRT